MAVRHTGPKTTIWGLDTMITFVLADFMRQSILRGIDKFVCKFGRGGACEMITVSSVEFCHTEDHYITLGLAGKAPLMCLTLS